MTKLTTTTYVKIGLVVALCLVLCGGLLSCSIGCSAAARHAGMNFQNSYEGYNLSEAGSTSLPADDVHNIEVDWLAGRVDFKVVSDDSFEPAGAKNITLVEANSESIPENQRMRWQLQGNTLRIGYGWQGWGLFSCSVANAGKHLTISIPESAAKALGTVDLTAASGHYDLGTISCDKLEVSLASGEVAAHGMSADQLNLDVASGNVRLVGNISKQMNIDVASGDINVVSERTCPKSASITLASGNMTLGLPQDSSFTTTLSRMSGAFNCTFPRSDTRYNQDGGCTVNGGDNLFVVDMMSGNVTISPM